MDQKRLRQKFLLNLASSPVTLVPTLVGATLWMGLWAFSITSLLFAMLGVLGIVAGIGSFFTRLCISSLYCTNCHILLV